MTDKYAHLDPDDARQYREQDARHPLDRQSEQRMLEALKEDITFGNPPAKAKYESLTGKWVYIPAFDDPTVIELLAIINRLTSQTCCDASPAAAESKANHPNP